MLIMNSCFYLFLASFCVISLSGFIFMSALSSIATVSPAWFYLLMMLVLLAAVLSDDSDINIAQRKTHDPN